MKKITVLFVVLLIIVNCAPSVKVVKNKDFGEYPENYKEVIKLYYSVRLKDPESARYEWPEEPFKGFYIEGGFKNPIYGYICPVGINAKNSFGGYTGMKMRIFIMKGNELLASGLRYEKGKRYLDESGFYRLEEYIDE